MEVPMGTRLFCQNLLAAMLIVSGSVACSVDRAGHGCPTGFASDMTGRCQASDGDVPIDIGFDANVDDAQVEPDADLMVDAGPDAPDAWVDPDSGPSDGGPPDGGPPDMGPPDAGPPDGGPIDGGPTDPPLIIRMTGATAGTGIAYRIIWNRVPPLPREVRGWYFDACAGGPRMVDATTVECTVYDPDLAGANHRLDFFPFDTGSGAAQTSFCTRATCPGAYSVTYGGLVATPITTIPDGYDANGSGFGDLGDGATLHIESLP
jgi:hypothetical protein